MAPDAGKAAFTLAVFITLVALLILPFQPRESAEFVVTVMALAVGLVFLLAVIVVVRRSR
jgi:hypothetical protein